MKKFVKWLGIVAFAAVIGFSLAGCDLNNDDDVSDDVTIDDTRILGTWTDKEGQPCKFSSNGKFTYTNTDSDIRTYNFSVVNNKLSFWLDQNYSGVETWQKYDISISADGNTILLTGGKQVSGWSVAGPGMPENQLSRKY